MAKTLNTALSSIYDRFVFTGSTRSEFYYTNGIGGDDLQVTALQLTTLKNVDDETVLTTDASQDVTLANDLKLLSDASVLNFGANNDVHLTHVADKGLLLTQNGSGTIPELQIRDSALVISSSTDGQLDIDADTELELGSATIDINASTACEIDNTNTTNGVKVGVNTSGGKVFIGHTTSETTVNDNLTVTGTTALSDHTTIAVNKQLKFGDGAQHIATDNSDLTITTDVDLLISAAKVGIGIAVPATKLHIDQTANNEGIRITSHATDTKYGEIYMDSNSYLNIVAEGDRSLLLRSGSSMQFIVDEDDVADTAMVISDASFVGIGTDTPAVDLDIEDQGTAGISAGGNLRLGSNDGTVMVNTNRLGVIEFAGAETAESDTGLRDGTMNVGARIEAVADATWSNSENGASLDFYTTDGDHTNITQRMTILANGNIGIGMDPNEAFNLKGAANSGMRLYHSNASTIIGKFEGDADQDGVLTLNTNGGVVDIVLNGQDGGNSYINTGQVGIGTALPDHLLHLHTQAGGMQIGELNSGGNAYVTFLFDHDGGTASQGLLTIETSKSGSGPGNIILSPTIDANGAGNVGIGAAPSTDATFHVTVPDGQNNRGCAKFENLDTSHPEGIFIKFAADYTDAAITDDRAILYSDSNSDNFAVYSDGGVVTVLGETHSDIRIKENIIDATSKLDEINQLRVRNFNLKGKNSKYVGFIADELEEVFPSVVRTRKAKWAGVEYDALKNICTDALVPMLVKAVQELSAKVEALENA